MVEDREDVWTLFAFTLAKTFPDVTIHRTANRRDTVRYIQDGLADRVGLPKLILQDLYLPERADGLLLLEDIRALLTNQQHIPTLVLSSSVDPLDVQHVYSRQASYYLVKPTDLSGWLSLCQAIRQF